MRSTRRSTVTAAATEKTRHAAATSVVRCRVFRLVFSGKESTSFQIPALEDQHRSAQGHSGIENGIESILQNQLRRNRLPMSYGGDHVKRRKIGNQIRHAESQPTRYALCHAGKAAQISGKAANHKQRECENGGKQRRRERRKQQRQGTDDEELQNDEI